jgi:hypothetical protein
LFGHLNLKSKNHLKKLLLFLLFPLLREAMDYSIDTINKTKEAETAFRHSEADLEKRCWNSFCSENYNHRMNGQ